MTAGLMPGVPSNVDLFFSAVRTELAHARVKHPREEGRLSDAEWLAVLTEEVGECARAIQDETDERLLAELVQVAQVALRWALSIPLGRERPPWATNDSVEGYERRRPPHVCHWPASGDSCSCGRIGG